MITNSNEKRVYTLYLQKQNRYLWQTEMSKFVLTSSNWAPGSPSHYGTITMWLIKLPLRMPLWYQCRIFGMKIMSMYTPSTSYFAQILATYLYGDMRVGPSDIHC